MSKLGSEEAEQIISQYKALFTTQCKLPHTSTNFNKKE